jgi:formylglycine-generating enzyme required for sulfatase activity
MPRPGEMRVFAGMTFVWVPPGAFMMGSSLSAEEVVDMYATTDEGVNPRAFENEHPQHPVTLSAGFWMGKYEVTQAEWTAVMGEWEGEDAGWNNPGANHPADFLTWEDAVAFVEALNESGQGHFRLPTEAEWEYACRAGTQTPFYFGSDASKLNDYAWNAANSAVNFVPQTHPVGTKLPNAWGLHDMLGNVQEFTADWYDAAYYGVSPELDPAGPETGSNRVLRGGTYGRTPLRCRCAFRGRNDPSFASPDQGMRLVRDPD